MYVSHIGALDAPHLDLATINEILALIAPDERAARLYGFPNAELARSIGGITDVNRPLTAPEREFLATGTLILEAMHRNARRRVFQSLYPEDDQTLPDGTIAYSRHKYPKHMEFFEAGAEYRERCAMAANRVGKSYGMGGYETVAHLTGLYPDWWVGRRFRKPIKAWAAGKTNETTRDIVQLILMGEPQMQGGRRMFDGTGLIPGNLIGSHTFKAGLPDLIDTVKIRHVSGGWSQLGFKSYQQGRGAFEGTERHVIWLDEEPPADVYGECLIRTATVNGLVLLTFTPLEGLSEVVLSFLPQEMRPDAPNPEEETS